MRGWQQSCGDGWFRGMSWRGERMYCGMILCIGILLIYLRDVYRMPTTPCIMLPQVLLVLV